MSFNLTAAASAATLPILNSCNSSIKTIKPIAYKKMNGSLSSNNLQNQSNGFKLNGNTNNNDNKLTHNPRLEEQFKAACDVIQNLPKNGPFQPSNELLLKFYGYFKQATQGSCKTSKPSIFKVVERAKWDAWYSVRELTKNEAMQGYIDEIKNIIETMPHNSYVQKLCEIIDPIFEFVNENQARLIENKNQDYNDDEATSDEELTINNNHIKLNGLNGNHSTNSLLNGNGPELKNGFHTVKKENGDLNYDTNSIEVLQSDEEEEDFCDTTSEFVNEQDALIQNIKKQLSNKETDLPKPCLSNGNNANESENYQNGYNEIVEENRNTQNKISSIIHKYGGEMNSPPTGSSNQQTQSIRQSRPSSSQSVNYSSRQISLNQSGGSGTGGGGSGGYPPNENFLNPSYISQDTNRQILLILLRLQQDTNNVITRLSYLEATVMSLTNNLQMNRIENSIQMNNQVNSAFSVVNNSPQNRNTNGASNRSNVSVSLYNWFRNIDWKTVSIALLWPFIIRLVFYLFRKIRLVVKFKRIRQEFGPKF